jgi:hypothetical protein
MATLESIIGWLSVQNAIALWPDAPGEPEDGYEELVNLLATAHEFLEGKGPKIDPPPERYKTAQILYMQHIYARKRTGNGESMGADGYQISTYPLVQEAIGYMRLGRTRIRGLR